MRHRVAGLAVLAVVCVSSLVAAAIPASAAEGRADGKVRIAGKVVSVDGATFTVKTPRRGEIKVQTDAKTTWAKGAASDLKEGMAVLAAGTLSNEVLHADKVAVGRPKPIRRAIRKARHGLKGEVTAVGENKFTLKTRKGPIEVHTSEQTAFRGGTEEDLSVGDKVAVIPVCAGAPTRVERRQAKDERRQAKDERRQAKEQKTAVHRDGPRACIRGNEEGRSVKARAVLFPPGGSFRKDALPTSESRLSA